MEGQLFLKKIESQSILKSHNLMWSFTCEQKEQNAIEEHHRM